MDRDQLTFGHKLRELREKNKMTQEQLAGEIGITANAIGQFERGKIFPNFETIVNIIRVLDVDANLFFSREGVDYPDEAKWIAGIIVGLNTEERQKFGRFLEGMAKVLLNTD